MARVTSSELALLVPAGPTDAELAAFIDDASAWVDAHLVGACTEMTTALLTIIEKYLAADLVTTKYPNLRSSTQGDTSETYAAAGDNTVSQYLRKAAQIDPCGIVQEMLITTPRPKGRFRVGAGYDPEHAGGGA